MVWFIGFGGFFEELFQILATSFDLPPWDVSEYDYLDFEYWNFRPLKLSYFFLLIVAKGWTGKTVISSTCLSFEHKMFKKNIIRKIFVCSIFESLRGGFGGFVVRNVHKMFKKRQIDEIQLASTWLGIYFWRKKYFSA